MVGNLLLYGEGQSAVLEKQEGTKGKAEDETKEENCGGYVESVKDVLARFGLRGLAVGTERGAHGAGIRQGQELRRMPLGMQGNARVTSLATWLRDQ